jgi:tetratricopeptide (TPR) repeat protein
MTVPRNSDCEALDRQHGPTTPVVIGIALILCAFWMFVWRGTLDGVFHFDDYSNIVDNEGIRRLGPIDNFLRNTRPIGLYSFAINYHFSGTDPFVYHVTNLAIHITNGLFLFTGCLLTWQLYRRHWQDESQPQIIYSAFLIAGLISTVWVVHPLTTQAVTNIVQRYESLASMGYLGVWIGMLLYLNGRRWLGCAIILPLAWIGLMSKEVFASAPLAVLLFDRLLSRAPWLQIAKTRWLPYILLLSPYIWFVPSVLRFFDPVRTADSSAGIGLKSISPWQYLRTQPEVIWNYLSLTVWPKQLCFDYLWRIQDNPWIYLPLGASLLGLIFFGSVAYWTGVAKGGKFLYGLGGWMILVFFFMLAPTSSIMPIADIAVEHRMYLPSAIVITAIVLLSVCLAVNLLRKSERPGVLKIAFACIATALISLLSWRTHLRNLDYRDALVLWQTAANASPENPRAWFNVGKEYIKRGDKASALPSMVKAVGYSNTPVPIYDVGLAECLHHIGRHEDAITLYCRAIAKKHDEPEFHNDLGAIYLAMNRLQEAQQSFETAVSMNFPVAKYNLAIVYSRQGNAASAVTLWEETLAADPNLHVAARQLAWTLATTGDLEIKDVKRAEQLLREHYDLDQGKALNSPPDHDAALPALVAPARSISGSPLPVAGRGAGGEGQSVPMPSAYVLDTWAAILAAKGEFEAAVKVATQALALAQSKPNESLIPELTNRLDGYQRGEPCIDGVQP